MKGDRRDTKRRKKIAPGIPLCPGGPGTGKHQTSIHSQGETTTVQETIGRQPNLALEAPGPESINS